jgi:hypothetical protein
MKFNVSWVIGLLIRLGSTPTGLLAVDNYSVACMQIDVRTYLLEKTSL